MKSSNKRTLGERLNNFGSNFPLSILTFFLVFFMSIRLVDYLESKLHLIGSNKSEAILVFALIIIISVCLAIFTYCKISPWINEKLSNKLDFPLSQMPFSIMMVIALIMLFVIILMCVNVLKDDMGMKWLPDGEAIATFSSVCVATVAYFWNSTAKFEITVKYKLGLLRDDDKLQGNCFSFWCTNVGGKAGNVKYVGWCEPEDREQIGLYLKNSDHVIHQFDSLVNNKLKKFCLLKPGEISSVGKVQIKSTDNLPNVFYLVFIDSVGKVYFRKIELKITKNFNNMNEKYISEKHWLLYDENKNESFNEKNEQADSKYNLKKLSYTISWTIVAGLILISIYNLFHATKSIKNIKWSFWFNSNYYNGFFLVLTAIVVLIMSLHFYKSYKRHVLFAFNCLMIEEILILIKPFLDAWVINKNNIGFYGVSILLSISWLVISTIVFKK